MSSTWVSCVCVCVCVCACGMMLVTVSAEGKVVNAFHVISMSLWRRQRQRERERESVCVCVCECVCVCVCERGFHLCKYGFVCERVFVVFVCATVLHFLIFAFFVIPSFNYPFRFFNTNNSSLSLLFFSISLIATGHTKSNTTEKRSIYAHHMYVLQRGLTTATICSVSFSIDSRWVALTSERGTTHVFPINPR